MVSPLWDLFFFPVELWAFARWHPNSFSLATQYVSSFPVVSWPLRSFFSQSIADYFPFCQSISWLFSFLSVEQRALFLVVCRINSSFLFVCWNYELFFFLSAMGLFFLPFCDPAISRGGGTQRWREVRADLQSEEGVHLLQLPRHGQVEHLGRSSRGETDVQ